MVDKKVALDRTMNIIDLKRASSMRSLITFIEEKLLKNILKNGDCETRLLRKLLEFEKF